MGHAISARVALTLLRSMGQRDALINAVVLDLDILATLRQNNVNPADQIVSNVILSKTAHVVIVSQL
jgi:hypothetical protein